MVTQLDSGQVTILLRQWRSGDEAALEALTPLVYSELRILARSRLVRHDQPDWANRAHFYYIAARLMRQILVDFIRESHARKRGGEAAPVSLNVAQPSDPSVIQIHEALNALAEMDARKARVLEMRFFGGLTAEEIAHIENMSPVGKPPKIFSTPRSNFRPMTAPAMSPKPAPRTPVSSPQSSACSKPTPPRAMKSGALSEQPSNKWMAT